MKVIRIEHGASSFDLAMIEKRTANIGAHVPTVDAAFNCAGSVGTFGSFGSACGTLGSAGSAGTFGCGTV